MDMSRDACNVVWRWTPAIWLGGTVVILLLAAIFFDGLIYMGNVWFSREEYSHGVLIPLVSLFMVWQKKDVVERTEFQGAWSGLLVIMIGLLVFAAGELSTLFVIEQYALIVVLAGVILALAGWKGLSLASVPVLLLVFMIPLPNFLLQALSSKLQLISSELGVWVIRLFDISVFLEGNVIDLGNLKLQVVEACSGLRYLFPLMAFGFITAYFYKAAAWKRVFVFFSSIPITILMNSFRIGVIGVMVEYWGKSMAEGFLHDFEGWVVFMACTGVLMLEMWILAKIGDEKRPWRELFGVELPAATPKGVQRQYRSMPASFIGALVLMSASAIAVAALPERNELSPNRVEFAEFPMQLGDWKGNKNTIEKVYLDVLKLDDYIIADFADGTNGVINLYAAYYASQKKGESAHSPRSCIPGDGWQIADLKEQGVGEARVGGQPLVVNRAIIRKGNQQQLVYYWFQQRGREITNEYLVKWYLFYDALTKNRTDGALVRLTTPIRAGENVEQGDERLGRFLAALTPKLEEYIPR